MFFLDVSRAWIILAPAEQSPVKNAAGDLLQCINMMKRNAGFREDVLLKGQVEAVKDSDPVIICSVSDELSRDSGFSWRAASGRVEISGASPRGLSNGIYDFLGSLGFSWPDPGTGIYPAPGQENPGLYPLAEGSRSIRSPRGIEALKRLVLDPRLPLKKLEPWLLWGLRNSIDAVLIPFCTSGPLFTGFRGKIRSKGRLVFDMICSYGFSAEAGGWGLSWLLRRKVFLFNRELFRMSEGRRKKRGNGCPTNPDTICSIQEEAGKFFRLFPGIRTFHLWPDRGYESVWCNCPSCRAFSMEEQNLIAVNAVSDALASMYPDALISYYELSTEKADIKPRANMFALRVLPGTAEAEKAGWFLGGMKLRVEPRDC